MALPVLVTRPRTNNRRVSSFLVASEETARQNGRFALQRDRAGAEALIEQAYRQIFFHAFKVDRDSVLESRLRSGQINVRDFVRQLLLSDKFRRDFYRCNSNYRIVEQIVGRVLGRPVHGQSEQIAWAIVIAQKGLEGFVDALLNSDEYLNTFGLDQVPYQRSRVLAGRAIGDRPFNQQAPRYDAYWREISAKRAPAGSARSGPDFRGALICPHLGERPAASLCPKTLVRLDRRGRPGSGPGAGQHRGRHAEHGCPGLGRPRARPARGGR